MQTLLHVERLFLGKRSHDMLAAFEITDCFTIDQPKILIKGLMSRLRAEHRNVTQVHLLKLMSICQSKVHLSNPVTYSSRPNVEL